MSRILVLDNDPATHEALHVHLTGATHQVLHAASVIEAIRIAARHEPQLIVLNIMLPNGQGLVALRWLSQLSVAPIILLSEADAEGRARSAPPVTGFSHVPKPIDLPVLDRAVAAALTLGERSVYLAPMLHLELEDFFYRLVPGVSGISGVALADGELLTDIVKIAARLDHILGRMKAVLHILRWEEHGVLPSWVSASISTVLGYERADRYTDPDWWRQRIHPENLDAVIAHLPLLHRDGHLTHEYRFRRRDGVYVWLREHLRLMVDEHDKPRVIIALWLDITEETQREEERRRIAPEPVTQSSPANPYPIPVPPSLRVAKKSWLNVTTPDGQPICPLCGAAIALDDTILRPAEFVVHIACWQQMQPRE